MEPENKYVFLWHFKSYTFYEVEILKGDPFGGEKQVHIYVKDLPPGSIEPVHTFHYINKNAGSLNKAIEEAKAWVNKLQTCRVCGCTEFDCKQCIEKTGHPCHWVEDDLCSACQEIPAQQSSSPNTNNMNFFQQLAAAGHVDFSFRILQKNGNLTINIKPGGTPQSLMPMNFTATPAEMDRTFFDHIIPAVKEVTELVSNIEDVKKHAAILPKAKPQANKKKSATKPVKSKKDKQKIVTKKLEKPQVAQPDAFAEPT